jgi:hypothetical protein
VFDIPPNALQIYTFLSGVHTDLPQEQAISSWSANCAANVDPINKRVTITGDALLNGVHGSVDVGFLVLTATSSPFQIVTTSGPPGDVSVPFQPSISSACSLITSFGGEFYGGPVVLMCAQAQVNIDSPPPINEVDIFLDVELLNHDHGTQNGNMNICVLAQNSTTSITRPEFPSALTKRIRQLTQSNRQ